MTDETLSHTIEPESHPASETPTQYGVGPFSVREVALVGVWLVAFVVSFFSVSTLRFDSVWTSGLLWILTIGVPTAAVFLIVLRRLSPDGIRRVGSLGVDQFASVAFTVSAVLWVQLVWETVSIAIAGGPWVRSWVIWVELVLMLIGVALTVFAALIPPFSEDFHDRREVAAHRNARPLRPVTRRPAPVQLPPAQAADAAPAHAATPSAVDGVNDTDVIPDAAFAAASAENDPFAAPAAHESWAHEPSHADSAAQTTAQPAVSHQAFWALAPVERDVVDEQGAPLFRIGPTAWALVIEDHATMYVVRHEDGRIGYLHDVSGVTRG